MAQYMNTVQPVNDGMATCIIFIEYKKDYLEREKNPAD
jgi:hypothetical protein